MVTKRITDCSVTYIDATHTNQINSWPSTAQHSEDDPKPFSLPQSVTLLGKTLPLKPPPAAPLMDLQGLMSKCKSTRRFTMEKCAQLCCVKATTTLSQQTFFFGNDVHEGHFLTTDLDHIALRHVGCARKKLASNEP